MWFTRSITRPTWTASRPTDAIKSHQQTQVQSTPRTTAPISILPKCTPALIKKSVFSIGTYQQVLQLKGDDTSKFDKEVGAAFKKSAKGSRVPDTEKVAIDRIMILCQRENGVDMAYGDLALWVP